MILLLELLCQLVLAYESFKVLKAPPPARKRRRANAGDDGAASSLSAYAASQRRKRIKTMAKAWLVFYLAQRIERMLDVFLAWWFPLYSTFRFIGFAVFLVGHKKISDIAYTSFLVPTLKPYEKGLDRVHSLLNDVLDILAYLSSLAGQQALLLLFGVTQPFRKAWATLAHLVSYVLPARAYKPDQGDITADAPDVQDTSKTPKRKGKPRYSQIATPYVPGHLVSEEVAFPPVQARLPPAERSVDDLPAFQEALDRAQAAFYEASSPARPKQRRAAAEPELEEVAPARRAINGAKAQRAKRKQASGEVDGAEAASLASPPKRRRKQDAATGEQPAGASGTRRVAPSSRPAANGRKVVEALDDDARPSSRQAARETRTSRTAASASHIPKRTIRQQTASEEPEPEPSQKAVTNSTQQARQTALAARKRAREATLARKEIGTQVDTRISKRKKAA